MKPFTAFSLLGRKRAFLQMVSGMIGASMVSLSGQVVIDGDFSDWESIGSAGGGESAVYEVSDGADMVDANGDLAKISASVEGEDLVLTMEAHGVILPAEGDMADGNTNRYYYHWLIDADNNPATGVSNATYENNPTGVERVMGTEIVVQFGWRNGAPDGVYAYNPLDPDEEAYISDYPWEKEGGVVTARIPYGVLGISAGQTVSVSAFQEGASDGWATDWMESVEVKITAGEGGGGEVAALEVSDAADMVDPSGDLAKIGAKVEGSNLVLMMEAHGPTLPTVEETLEGNTNRYYYHWLIDADNNAATGVSNATYENNPTGVERVIGTEIVVQFGWRNGAPDGVYAYNPLDPDEEAYISDYPWEKEGNTVVAMIPYEVLGLSTGQTVSLSAFQEGASDGWATDWMESVELKLESAGGGTEVPLLEVEDPSDMADSSGDLAKIGVTAEPGVLLLTMQAHGEILPTVEQTPDGMTNRYYNHWLIDTDNNAATGVSNATYENNPTGVQRVIGTEIIVQFGWRNGAPDGVYAYNPLDPDEEALISDYAWEKVDGVIHARLPFDALGLAPGQTVAVSAFQEGASDGWATDWMESVEFKLPAADSGGVNTNIVVIDDPTDDMLDPSGDLKQIRATTDGAFLFLGMTVESIFGPAMGEVEDGLSNRYYYHWLIDADNNAATGVSNATYENNPTNVERPVGSEVVVQIGWRDGAPDGVYAYDPTDPDEGGLISEYEFAAQGDSVEAKIPLEALGLSPGQKVGISAFQEGASDGWATDWMESGELLLAVPGTGGSDLSKQIFVDAYGFTVVLEDGEGVVSDLAEVSAALNGTPMTAEARQDGTLITVTGRFDEWLVPQSEHRLVLTYPGGQTEVPVVAPEYTVIPATYGAHSLDGVPRGFAVNVSQISEFQTREGTSAHEFDLEKAELQLAGRLFSSEGKPFYNEASERKDGWWPASTSVEGILNWSEDAPTDAGYFSKAATNQADEEIPLVPGASGSANGLVIEVIAYLELEAGYHRLGVNTLGGYQASMGPDGRDRLAPVLGSYSEAVRYSFLGDKYFDVLVPEAGYYPVRVLFTHTERDKEGASMEFFSLKGAKRIAINDPEDPEAIKAYQFVAGASTFVSQVSPTPGTDYAQPNAPVEIMIEQGGAPVVAGSVEMRFDGALVSPQISEAGNAIGVRYFPGAMDWGSAHEVEFAYTLDTDPPLERREVFDFGVYRNAFILPSDWASPVEAASEPGFAARVVQEPGPRGNSISEAEKQLAREGSFSAEGSVPVINLGGGGLFQDDTSFSDHGLLGDNTDYFSMEALTYLHLKPGAYTMGVNSDDGFQVSVGREIGGEMEVLEGWDSGRGIEDAEPQDLYDLVVRQEGVYAFRLLYFQGVGGSAVEWYLYDREEETAILLNTEGAPAAYQERGASPEAFAGPRISAPLRADFGSIPITAENLPSGFIVHNTGSEPLMISETTVSGADASHFLLEEAPDRIEAGASGLFRLVFDPQGQPGGYVAAVDFGTNDAAQPSISVELTAGALDPIGPTAYYALDETEGVLMRDGSGNQRDGDYSVGEGAVQLNQSALAAGSAVAFRDGAFARVSGARFGFWEDFTLTTWLQTNRVDDVPQMVFGKGDPSSGNPNFALLFNAAGLIWFAGSEPEFASETMPIQPNRPHHVAVSFRTAGEERWARLYVDGVLLVEQPDPSFIATGVNEPLYFGSFQGAVALDGTLDDIQLYDRALGADDLHWLFEHPGQTLASEVVDVPDPPVVGGDLPELTAVTWSANGFSTAFATETGVTYTLEYSADLQVWETVRTLEGDGSSQSFDDEDAGRQALPAGFYRVSLP